MRFIALNKAFRPKDSRIVEVSLQPKEKPCLSRHNLIRHPLALTLRLRALSMLSSKVSGCMLPHPYRVRILRLLRSDAESMRISSSILFCTLVRSCSSVPLVFSSPRLPRLRMRLLFSVSSQWRLEQLSSTELVCSPTVSLSVYVSPPTLLQQPVWRLFL